MSLADSESTFGFTDKVTDSQASFRALMDAFSHPAVSRDFPTHTSSWGAMPASNVTLLLTLVDQDTAIWLEEAVVLRLTASANLYLEGVVSYDLVS